MTSRWMSAGVVLMAICAAPMMTWAQTAPQAAATAAPAYVIRGQVQSGGVRLPGVTVTASHSLTGRRVMTSTNVDGSFRLELPGRGRWVLRADFAAFAAQTAEIVLSQQAPEVAHNFELLLLSRVPKSTDAADVESAAVPAAARQSMSGRGAQRLSLQADGSALAQAAASGEGEGSTNVSGFASTADAGNDSVSVSGRMGNAQDFGLQNMDDLRERIDELRARGQLNGPGLGGDGPGGGSPGGGMGMGMGGPGGGGGGRMRIGSLTKPHGQLSYQANNGILDAAPYALGGGEAVKPAYGSNRFGGMVGGPFKIPHLYDDGGKTFAFLDYNGTRSTTPYDRTSSVPTLLERAGDFRSTLLNGKPVSLYDPTTGAALGGCLGTLTAAGACIGNISPQAAALLRFIPTPNLDGSAQNYRYVSAADNDTDMLSLRLTHNFGASSGRAMPPPPPGMPEPAGAGGRSRRARNNVSFGLNYQRNQSQTLEPFPSLYGSSHTNGYSSNVGWSLSRAKWTNQLRFTWNRSRSHADSHFANVTDVATGAGIAYAPGLAPMSDAANWGLPALNFSHYTSLADISPSVRDSQTFSLSESVGWVRGKHHLHFGGDYRWIDNQFYASTNPRGSFTFNGASTAGYSNGAALSGTGYDFADFLLGYAQQTSLAYSTVHDRFLGHSYDLFVQDDWRMRAGLTLNFGLRYEFQAPFHESQNRLVNLIPLFVNGDFTTAQKQSAGGANGRELLRPDRNNFAPRIGLAWKPFGKTVVRVGYSINYNLSQYASIVQNLAAQPNYAITQTNNGSTNGPSGLTLASAFTTPSTQVTENNYAVDPAYRTAYVQMWNLNMQQELSSTLVLNVGYTGSKGSKLDMLRAPNRDASGLINSDFEAFNWETSQGSSILHAGSVRLRKRMSRGMSAGGTYTWSKSIDNASSIGGTGQVVAQDDHNLRAERGLSSFDQRHKLSADWLLELPWGEGRHWMTRPGAAQKIFGDWMLQSTISAASGTPYTAHILGDTFDLARGSNGTLRANYNGESLHVAHRSAMQWFNTAAFSDPAAATYGNAGRNTIIGPGSWLMSLALSKNFPIREQMGLEVRAEAANLLNHANYSGIDTTVDSRTYGEVTSVASMRKMTLSMRYRF